MKTINRLFMLAAFVFIACLTSCKKEETNPELSARIAGDYKLTYIKQGGKLYYPNSTTKGNMVVSAESPTSVKVIIDVTNGNAADNLKGTLTGVALTEAGSGEITLTKDGFALGSGGNNQLSIKIAPTNGAAPYEIIGTK